MAVLYKILILGVGFAFYCKLWGNAGYICAIRKEASDEKSNL